MSEHTPGPVAAFPAMTFAEFHNALRILLNIDFDQFEQALADSPEAAEEEWTHFQKNPYRYFIASDDHVARALFAIIHERNAGTRAMAAA